MSTLWDLWACYWRGHHDPARHYMGGFRCVTCGATGADLEEMGFPGEAYVPPLRRVFNRGPNGGSERTSEWH